MSCTLNALVSIRNINGILEWFQLDEEIDWDTKWDDWDGSEMEIRPQQMDTDWLEKCLSCLSPMGNVAVIAHNNRIAILTADDLVEDDDKATLSVTWKGTVGEIDGDEITDLICLPLVSQNKSSAGTPDWTCVIIGFKSGYVSVYSENGMSLFSQIYEENPVIKLECRTFTLGEFGIPLFSDMSTEFIVAYQKCVVSINGTHFLETLRLCRKRAAKVSAGSQKLEDLPPLKYKKYSLAEQEYLSSCVSAGSLVLRLYEKLVHESIAKGFVEHVSGNITSKGQLLTVGEMPYFGIIEMTDESTPVYFRDVAIGLASNLKKRVFSAASGWLFPLKGSSTQAPKKPTIEPAAPASFRTFLPDRRRVGVSVALSPSRRLAAVTDSFGRVVVFDVVRGTAVKMWKGYRDAECGWQEVVDEWGGEKRKVSFLIIYAPRRGLLEVWLPQQGPRMAAFNVSKQASLLYNHHIVLGHVTSVVETYQPYPVMLLNPSGVIELIQIPFHLALSSKTDRQARDQHLLKEIKSYMKKMDEDSIISLVKELETVYGKLQFIIMVMSASKFSIYLVENALAILNEVTVQREETVADSEKGKPKKVTKPILEPDYSFHEENKLNVSLKKIFKLIEFYKYITSSSENKCDVSSNEDEAKTMFAKLLMIKLDEIDYLPVLSPPLVKESSSKKVKIENETDKLTMGFHSFMSSFQVIGTDVKNNCDIQINTNKDVPNNVKRVLTNLILLRCEIASLDKLLNAINASGIDPLDLMEIVFYGWYEAKEKSVSLANKFSLLLTSLFFLKGDYFIENDDMSGFWFLALKSIYSWTNIPMAELTAIICRGLDQNCASFLQDIATLQKDKKPDRMTLWNEFMQYLHSDEYKYISLNEWEPTTAHLVEWNIFIGRIKCLLGLFEMLRKQKSQATISVRLVVDNGSGYITELVAKYVIQRNISPDALSKILNKFKPIDSSEIEVDYPEEDLEPELKSAYDDIAAVKKNFGVSMEKDCILCNVCWELGVIWQKNPNKTIYLTNMVDFFRSIDYSVITLGTGILIWQFLLKDRIFNVTNLTEKCKRIPSDRMSVFKIGISQPALVSFFIESRRFLDSLLDLIVKGRTSAESKPSIRESFWNFSDRAGLADRARNASSELSPNMIHLHMDLVYILDLINELNLNNVSVYALFSDEQRRVLFKPLTDIIYSTKFLNVNPTVFEGRIDFLKQIISKGVEELPDDFDDIITKIVPPFYTRTVELARIWNCDADIIRRHYVIELLYSGLDVTAQTAMRWINLLDDLPEKIFAIGGLRLKYLIDTLPGPQLVKLMTSISPLITNWTRDIKPVPLRNPKASMAKTKISMNSVFDFLPGTSSHYTPGKYLLMAFDSIIREGFE